VGSFEGSVVGCLVVGDSLGESVGGLVIGGLVVGDSLGESVGESVGGKVIGGLVVGESVGGKVNKKVGVIVGGIISPDGVGVPVGIGEGSGVLIVGVGKGEGRHEASGPIVLGVNVLLMKVGSGVGAADGAQSQPHSSVANSNPESNDLSAFAAS